MSKRARRLKVIERRWLERFGEPPTLRTDPDLMQRILDREGGKPDPSPQRQA
jgi:hypothetical protein